MKRFIPRFFSLLLLLVLSDIAGFAWGINPPADDMCQILVPSAISPNGDGINDYLEIKANCHFESCTFSIYDSRSRVIFETTQLDQTWDATVEGKIVAEGHYTWELTYQIPEGATTHKGTQRGVLTIIR